MKVNSTSASIKFKVKTAGTYVLNYTVSSESGYDKAYFYKDGTELKNDSGSKSGSIILENLTTSNVIEVKYSKDSSSSSGNDNVVFSLGTQSGQATDNRYVFGNSFRYENGNYILQNTIKAEGGDNLSNNHYTCLSTSDTCSELKYIYYKSSSSAYYVTLTGGTKTITDVKNDMLYVNDVNRYNSAIKGVIDAWYAQNMNNYTNYLEDAIYCNDRTEGNASSNGWNPNGGSLSTSFQFKDYSSNTVLKCNNVTDQFAVGNTKAKLTYPVGLATYPEMNLLGNSTARNTGQAYYMMSPHYLSSNSLPMRTVSTSGSLSNGNSSSGIRPVISLKSTTEYTSGTGSPTDPYVIDTDTRPKITTSVEHGTITATSYVNSGDNKTINYSPDSGYILKSIKVDGQDVSISTYANSYTFTNITERHRISVVYAKPTITTNVTNGTITPTSEVEIGTNKTISYSPTDSSYVLDSIEVDGVAVSTSTYANSYTFTNVTGHHTITVVYRQLTTADFQLGGDVNAKMKNLANNSSSMNSSSDDTLIQAIKRANSLPSGFTPSTENTVSTSSSQYPIYIFFDDTDGTMYYYTEADIVYLGRGGNPVNMFTRLKSLTDISGLSVMDASKATDISQIFQGCSSLSNITALSSWDTSSVTYMGSIFYNCTSLLNINALNSWDTSNVEDMSGMFSGCRYIENIDALENWDTSKVKSMNGMFDSCSSLTNINALSNWDTSSVTGMLYMFSECSLLEEIDGASSWDTSSVTSMNGMFQNCTSLTDIDGGSNWDTSNVTSMSSMFAGCSSLVNIDGASNWDTSSVTSMSSIFSGCRKASGTFPILGNPTSYGAAFSNAAKESGARITVVYHCIRTTNIDNIIATKTSNSDVVKGSCMTTTATFTLGQVVNEKMKNLANNSSSMSYLADDTVITAIKRANSLPNGFVPTSENTVSTSDSEYPIYIYFDDTDGTMYYYSEGVTVYLNVYSDYMFKGLKNLTDISGLSAINTSKVRRMHNMFDACGSLTDIDDIAAWDVSNVVSMYYMFIDCSSLTNIDGASDWDTSKVNDMSLMFQGCSSLTNIDGASNWDTSKVREMDNMFRDCSSLANINGASLWDTSTVVKTSYMFYNCSSLANINGVSNWDTSRIIDMSAMFSRCNLLTDINALSNWDTSEVTSMSSMFNSCSRLANINGARNWDTSGVTSMSDMFYYCYALTNIDGASDWDTSKVTTMGRMFNRCDSLTNINGASNWNTSKVTTMNSMFSSSSLTNINALSDWDTSKVTNMSGMFYMCTSLTNIDGASNWDTHRVTNMSGMFSYCNALTNIDGASNWDTSSVTDVYSIFRGCSKASGIFPILGNPTTYSDAFKDAATQSGAEIVVVYDCAITTNIDAIIATKSSSSHVEKGSCINGSTTVFDIGETVNGKMKNLANNSSSMTYESVDTAITAIKRSNSLPNGFVPSAENTVSTSGSKYPIYIYFDNTDGTMYYYSEADTVYLHINPSYMFSNFSRLTNISGLSSMNSSKTVSMAHMFEGCSSLTNINTLSDWNTSKVASMAYMFSNCSSLADIDGVSTWDTSKVTNMNDMLAYCTSLGDIDGLSNWDVSGVTTMHSMLHACESLSDIDALANWDTSSVDNMSLMFYGCTSLENIDGASDWNMSNVTNLQQMFYYCSKLKKLDLSSFDTSKVINMNNMFSGCDDLEILDISNFKISASTSVERMFTTSYKLTTIYLNDLESRTKLNSVKPANATFYTK